MRVEDYPPQEPLPEFARAYADEVMRRGEGVRCTDYSYGADPYQGISLQVPEKPNGTVLALVHGGGWTCGYKEHMNFIGPSVTAANVIFASIGYRLAPGNVFPACADDVAAAIAWLHDHAGEFGGDPGRIFAGGHSAGGHLTALLAVRRDWQAARGLPEGVPGEVAGDVAGGISSRAANSSPRAPVKVILLSRGMAVSFAPGWLNTEPFAHPNPCGYYVRR